MSPKSHKGKAKLRKSLGVLRPTPPPVARPTAVPTTPAFSASRTAAVAPAPARYDYVLSDLKLIGILSGAMFVLLVILSFIIH